MKQYTAPNHIENLLEGSQSFINAGEFVKATGILQQIFKIEPRNLKARSLFGFCAFHQGDLQTAEQNWRWVLGKNPQNLSAQKGMELLTNHYANIKPSPPSPSPTESKPSPQVNDTGERHKTISEGRKVIIFLKYFVPISILWLLFGEVLWDLLGNEDILPRRYFFPESEQRVVFYIGFIVIAFIAWLITILAVKIRKKEIATTSQTKTSEKRAPQPKPSIKHTPQPKVIKKQDSKVGSVIMSILWLPLLALGGYIGWFIGLGVSESEGEALIGAIAGVITSQAIQATLIKRKV